ncbi:hypothetical protein GpartN1_g274.t1 [Galdieria partita]|uniref:RNA methyltransferase n=1 Tax=Galdieria partita TaxID=83374 RepID=A0A9C7UMC5_9RHOD|nr:hypothetical protein GpartN1_g274.t1 [Galdieria partita]
MIGGTSLTFVWLDLTFKKERCKDLKWHKTRPRTSSLLLSPIFKAEVCRTHGVVRGEGNNLQETGNLQDYSRNVSESLNCQHFSICDGCSLEHSLTNPPCSKKMKEYFWRDRVRLTLHCNTQLHSWRSIARLAVRRDVKGRTRIGLFKEDTHSVVEIPHCRVHHPLINRGVEIVKSVIEETGVSGYDEDRGEGQLRYIQLSVEHCSQTVQAAFVWNASRLKDAGPLCKRFLRNLERKRWNFHSLWLNFNTSRGNRIFNFEQSSWLLYSGRPHVVESIGGVNLYFPPYVFRQSNMEMLKKLIEEIGKYIEPRTKVLEFYAGVGTIGIPVAHLTGARLVGACELNGLSREAYLKAISILAASQRRNTEFFIGTAATHRDKLRLADVIIVDPPRSGMDYALAARLSSVKDDESLKRIIYVSCKFESLQRDLEIIQRNGIWKLRRAEAFLFFPGTDHWELLCVLDRKI